MADAGSDSDRLPWLDAPRPAKPTRATRRAQRPLFVLLGLFFAGAIAVMAYLTGRSTAPVANPAPVATATPTAPTPSIPAPVPARTAVAPAPAVTTPAPAAAAPVRVAAAKPRAKPAQARPKTSARRSPARRAPSPVRATIVQRPVPNAYPVPRRQTAWPARPFAGPRGRVILVGAFTTQPQADAAWWRLARAYPYLGTLPRVMTAVGPSPGRPRYYQVRLAASSRREARALCRNLHRIGRGCAIV